MMFIHLRCAPPAPAQPYMAAVISLATAAILCIAALVQGGYIAIFCSVARGNSLGDV